MMRASPSKLIHSAIPGSVYKLWIVMAFGVRQKTQNRRDPPFIVMQRIGYAHPVFARSIPFPWNILSTSVVANCITVGPVLYVALCTGWKLSSLSSIQCFAVVIRPKYQSHMSANSSEGFSNLRRCSSYLFAIIQLSRQSSLRDLSSVCWTASYFCNF